MSFITPSVWMGIFFFFFFCNQLPKKFGFKTSRVCVDRVSVSLEYTQVQYVGDGCFKKNKTKRCSFYQYMDELMLLANLFFDPRSQGPCKIKQCGRLQTESAAEDSLAVTYIASEDRTTFIARSP